MKANYCDHARRGTGSWTDTAGMVWNDDACSKCGRRWRWRSVPFLYVRPDGSVVQRRRGMQ